MCAAPHRHVHDRVPYAHPQPGTGALRDQPAELRERVRAAVRELTGAPGTAATVDRIARYTGLTGEEVRAGLQALQGLQGRCAVGRHRTAGYRTGSRPHATGRVSAV
ncbi:hypothetical protein [Streptomyces qinglanensis]|uniref:Uncharacterized protein n=1 Tax=Streptomyces qinglanensis TaxID=943816 RepID=A0A1H9N8J8_9ACTN|nr:hypothetical protein [Streptomyces qinglanensis]SER31975.1 hypothetical protein SAMN05421870_101173 [Streptomyces qinglanensis]